MIPFYYLISKYGGREKESFEENCEARAKLNQLGLHVYSPICDSHPYDQWLRFINSQNGHCIHCGKHFDLCCCINSNIEFKNIYPTPNYVAEDLALLNALCIPIDGQGMIWGYHKYQPNVVAVVLNSAMKSVEMSKNDPAPELRDEKFFNSILFDKAIYSKGSIKEYVFCKSHHILVLPLDVVLTKPQSEWESAAL